MENTINTTNTMRMLLGLKKDKIGSSYAAGTFGLCSIYGNFGNNWSYYCVSHRTALKINLLL